MRTEAIRAFAADVLIVVLFIVTLSAIVAAWLVGL